MLTAGSEDQVAANTRAMTYVETEMSGGKGGEDMFRDLRQAKDAEDATPETIALYDAVDELGEQLEEVFDKTKMNGGVCTVS